MITLDDVQALVDLALEPECHNGSIRVLRPSTGPKDPGLKFGNRVPTNPKRAQSLAKAIFAAIRLDWEGSAKKEPRSYSYEVITQNGTVETARAITFAAEPVTQADLQNEALSAALVAVQKATETIGVPFDQMKELNAFQSTTIEALTKENARLNERVAELEGKRSGVVEVLAGLQEQRGQALVFEAEAEAKRLEAQAKAGAWQDFGKAALINAPRMLQIAAHLMGAKIPALGGSAPPAGPNGAASGKSPPAGQYKPPSRPMSAETAKLVRELAAQLDDVEISGLVKFAWDHDPAGMSLFHILKPERRETALSVFNQLSAEWGV